MPTTPRLTGFTLSLLLLAGCADNDEAAPVNGSAIMPSDAAELAAASDGQWLSLTGSVVSAAPDSFLLDYGAGNVTVEMDDWDGYQEGRLLKAGDLVTVSGLADQDLFTNKRIEARSVYVRNLNRFFFASSADEEEFRASGAMAANVSTYADFTGRVTAVEGREFTIAEGTAAVRVDTSSLPDNPLDSRGVQQVQVGDRVLVWGDIDLEASEGAEIKARGLITLVANSTTARPTSAAGTPVSNPPPSDNSTSPTDVNSAGAMTNNSAGSAGN